MVLGDGSIFVDASLNPVGSGVTLSGVIVTGTLAGPGTLTVPKGGSVAMSGATLSELDLVDDGSVTVDAGTGLQLDGASALENTGTVTLGDGASVGYDNTFGEWINAVGGVVSYGGGSQGASISVPFDNLGTVSATAGGAPLRITDGNAIGVDSGTYSAGAGAMIAFTGGLRVFSGTQFTGSGSEDVNGATVVAATALSIPDLVLNGGVLTGSNTVTVPTAGKLTLDGGELSGGIRLVNDAAASVVQGANNVSPYYGNATLENAGTLTFADGSVLEGPGITEFDNGSTGTIKYAGGLQGASIDVPFNNEGAVSVSVGSASGTLSINAGNSGTSIDGGSYSASTNGTIEFGSGTRILANTFSFAGPGTFEISGATIEVPGAVSISHLVLAGGGLAGPATITVPAGGALTMTAGSAVFGGAHLVNQSTSATIQAGNSVAVYGGAELENAGTLTIDDGASLSYPPDPGELVNDGGATIDYGGGSQGATIALPFDNHGTVNVNVGVKGGVLSLSGGNTLARDLHRHLRRERPGHRRLQRIRGPHDRQRLRVHRRRDTRGLRIRERAGRGHPPRPVLEWRHAGWSRDRDHPQQRRGHDYRRQHP